MKKRFLAGLSRAEFLRRHWQKTALFARAAFPTYGGAITRDQLFSLATQEDAESRIVSGAPDLRPGRLVAVASGGALVAVAERDGGEWIEFTKTIKSVAP